MDQSRPNIPQMLAQMFTAIIALLQYSRLESRCDSTKLRKTRSQCGQESIACGNGTIRSENFALSATEGL